MKKTASAFIGLALTALLAGAIFGILAAFQYLFPEFLKDTLAFNRMRPFHVSTALGWIILCATGGIYYYLQNSLNLKLFSPKMATLHLLLFAGSAVAIYASFLTHIMGGREYLEYYPLISLPILAGWILFGINFFKTTWSKVKVWPVYLWMWGTGIVFMIYHFSEAHFWLIPFFRENYIKDITVQWKSYGSFVGSWNMLVYGTAIFVMAQIKNSDAMAKTRKAFFFYFLGLTNLMLGWAHHSYIIPMQPWIRYLAYIVSMLEWILLFNIIWEWKNSISKEIKLANNFPHKFLLSTDFWIIFNLLAALLISIPAINYYTHGTHITVLHSMGTTIGINTTILLASAIFIFQKEGLALHNGHYRILNAGFWTMNISLFLFLISLLGSGIKRSIWMYFNHANVPFGTLQNETRPLMVLFLVTGFGLLTGFILIVSPLIKHAGALLLKKGNSA